MSDTVLVPLITGASTGLVGITGIALTLWNSHQEREHRLKQQESEQEERYRIGLYEKRLWIYQKAFTWSQNLGRSAFMIGSRNGDPESNPGPFVVRREQVTSACVDAFPADRYVLDVPLSFRA